MSISQYHDINATWSSPSCSLCSFFSSRRLLLILIFHTCCKQYLSEYIYQIHGFNCYKRIRHCKSIDTWLDISLLEYKTMKLCWCKSNKYKLEKQVFIGNNRTQEEIRQGKGRNEGDWLIFFLNTDTDSY